jgi:hypothetical protein
MSLHVDLPDELIEAIAEQAAERAAAILAQRQGAAELERLPTVDQLAAHLGVDPEWVRRHQTELGAYRLSDGGGRNPIRFRRSRVEAFLEARRLRVPPGRRNGGDWRSDPSWADGRPLGPGSRIEQL